MLCITGNVLCTKTDARSNKTATFKLSSSKFTTVTMVRMPWQKSRKVSWVQSLVRVFRRKCPHFWRYMHSLIIQCRFCKRQPLCCKPSQFIQMLWQLHWQTAGQTAGRSIHYTSSAKLPAMTQAPLHRHTQQTSSPSGEMNGSRLCWSIPL